jgi:hypothetical protein
MDLYGIRIKVDRENKIYDDVSTLTVLSMHEGEVNAHLYIDVDPVIDPVTIKICQCVIQVILKMTSHQEPNILLPMILKLKS